MTQGIFEYSRRIEASKKQTFCIASLIAPSVSSFPAVAFASRYFFLGSVIPNIRASGAVDVSTTFPFSITTNLSASFNVDNLCAIKITVLPSDYFNIDS